MARDAPCPLTPVPPTVGGLMPLFSVTVREHTYTGRFYSDVVQAGSCEEALQAAAERAAVPWPPPGPTPQAEFDVTVTGRTRTGRLDTGVVHAGRREDVQEPAAGRREDAQEPAAGRREDAQEPAAGQAAAPRPAPGPPPQRGFTVAVREQAPAGGVYTENVQAASSEEALLAAAELAAAPQPSPGPEPQADAAGQPACGDVWIYSLLHCELVAGHDPPHMAVARGYSHPVRWVRDDRGVAHTLPDPATRTRVASPTTPPSPPSGR